MTTQAQTQIAKTTTTAKAPAKRASKAKAKTAAATLAYTLIDRPVSGKRLFAFTQAVLELSGLEKGKGIAKATLVKASGATAVRYHHAKGTMATDDKGITTLTAAGRASFASRLASIDPAILEAYKELMTTGKVSDAVCKNADNIKAIA